jgi:serine/threonine protein kinase
MNYFGNLLSSFNQKYSFTIKEEELTQDYSNKFKLYKGTKAEREITVFILDLKRNSHLGLAGKNAYKKLKSIKFPSILSFVDGVEEDDKIIICTEYVTPLTRYLLDSSFSNDSLLWGLYSIGKSVEFLNRQGIIHGNLNVSSVFLTRSGEWKLSGMEFSATSVEEFLQLMPNAGSSRDMHLPRGNSTLYLNETRVIIVSICNQFFFPSLPLRPFVSLCYYNSFRAQVYYSSPNY